MVCSVDVATLRNIDADQAIAARNKVGIGPAELVVYRIESVGDPIVMRFKPGDIQDLAMESPCTLIIDAATIGGEFRPDETTSQAAEELGFDLAICDKDTSEKAPLAAREPDEDRVA
jgi:hypothetical protein